MNSRKLLLILSIISFQLSWSQATLPVSRTSWATTPTGWTDSGIGKRTSSFACSGNDGGIFDNNGDQMILWFNTVPTQLVFKLKSTSMSGASELVVEESDDGTTYTPLGNYGTALGSTAITNCADITLGLLSTSRYIRWTYTKVTGNCDIDDINVTVPTCTQPTTQATLPTSTAITNFGGTIGWTRGTGDNVLVVARQGSAVNADPASGTAYTANAAFGSGDQIGTGNYVVYKGAGTSVAVTALLENTTYHYAVYEYNNTGLCYKLAGLTGNFTTTRCSPTVQATSFTSSSVTATSATVGWTSGNGNRVLLVGRAGGAVNADPATGTAYTGNAAFGSGTQIGTGNYVLYSGATLASVPITGLTASTTYHFAIYEFNSSGICYNLTELTGNFTTPAGISVIAFSDIPTQVAAANVPQATTDHVIYKLQLAITNASATLTQLQVTTTGTYLATDITGYKLRYSTDAVLDAGDVTLKALAASAPGTKTFNALTQLIPVGTTGYLFVTVDIAPAAVVTRTIAVNAVVSSNITVSSPGGTSKIASPSIPTAGGTQTIVASAPDVPTNFTEGCSSNTTQELSWSAPATGTYDGYLLVVRAAGTPNGVNAIVAASQPFTLDYSLAPTYAGLSRVLYIGSGTTATVTGLTPGISYTYALHAYKNNGATSLFSTATTTTQVAMLPNVTIPAAFAGNTSAIISWINPAIGCYDGIMAVVTTAPGITFAPTGNGSAYTANPAYAAPNQVVFKGPSNFVPITGLTNGVTYYIEIFVRNGTEWSSGVEIQVTPNLSTVFKPGELVFVGFDAQYLGSGGQDEYMVATMVDILPGTTFSIANSRFEAGAAANVRTNKWGGSGDNPSGAPAVTNFTYNGPGNITAGSVLVLNTNGSDVFSYMGVITGTVETDRTSAFTTSQPFGTAPNITTQNGDGEQIYLLQGSYVYDGVTDATEANYYLSGTLLHGFTMRVGWVPLTTACSGATSGGNTRQSRLPVELNCFNVESVATNTQSGFYKNSAEHGSASIRTIIIAISNVASNWTLSNGRYTTDATSSAATRAGKTFIIGTGNPNGQWNGSVDTNWFNCANWERLTVPDEFVDVIVNGTATRDAIISYTAPFADTFSNIAQCKNVTISGRKLVVEGTGINNLGSNNKIEVYGNVAISGTGVLDMDDSATGTEDGQLYLQGDWTSVNNASFLQGESTVHFVGGAVQVINTNTTANPEEFYNVVLDNDFNTATSNDLIAEGNLTINSSKQVSIDGTDGYIRVHNKLTNNGDVTIESNGQLIQVNDTDINDGDYSGTKFTVKREYTAKDIDYVYWGAPTKSFAVANLPNGYRYEWNPVFANTNGTFGNWITPSTPDMTSGKGYIARTFNGSASNVTNTFSFSGQPNNGLISVPVSRGNIQGLITDPPLSYPIVGSTIKWDDNWNLVGNPYPSAIKALSFLSANSSIEGFVYVWTHGTAPSAAIPDPFYYDFVLNYSSDDYIIYNGTGTVKGPSGFDGIIASGQGFFVLMKDGPATSENVIFNNSMRSTVAYGAYNNSQFYRNAAPQATVSGDEEKHRIWLDIISPQNTLRRTLVGYVDTATNEKDRLFDAVTKPLAMDIYSFLDNQDIQEYCIQGRGLPFLDSDTVKIGINVATVGEYKIAIGAVDGLFTTDQDIYLEDKLLNVIHDLRVAPYTFTTQNGIFNDRFVLRYTTAALGTADFENANQVIVSNIHGEITVKSFVENIQEVTVYDILGRQLFHANTIGAIEFSTSNVSISHQSLIVKIKLTNGVIITRKIVF